MRIVYMANNWVGLQVVDWLVEQGEQIVALVLHPDHMAKHREEIVEAAGAKPDSCFKGQQINQPETVATLAELEADLALSVSFGFILRKPIIDLFPRGCINLHPAYLPYNRGGYPNVWSIVEGTPAGVTLHYIDEGVDTGQIIAQRKIEVEPVDTGQSLYRKLERASVDLFKESWPAVRDGRVAPIPQSPERGTTHRDGDVARIDEIDLDASYRAGDLINVLRARTFPPHRGAYFVHNGRRIYMQLSLSAEQ